MAQTTPEILAHRDSINAKRDAYLTQHRSLGGQRSDTQSGTVPRPQPRTDLNPNPLRRAAALKLRGDELPSGIGGPERYQVSAEQPQGSTQNLAGRQR